MALSERHAAIKNETIGSSDIASLLGESPFAQPMDLYLRLVGEKPVTAMEVVSEDDPRFLGAEMEAVVRERYRRRIVSYLGVDDLDVVVEPYEEPVIYEDAPYISSAPDSMVGINGVVMRVAEFKVLFFADRREWGAEETDDVPAYYLLQCHHHMLVTNLPVCDLFVWFGRHDFRHYIVERDPAMDRVILEHCARFWDEHIEARQPPTLQYDHNGTEALIKELYPGTNGKAIELPEELVSIHDSLQYLNAKRLSIEKACTALKNELADAMGESALAYLPGREKGAWVRQVQRRKETVIPAGESLVMRFSDRKERK
jgi:predicted phage-related endonuclease